MTKVYTKEKLLNLLKDFYEKNNKVPTTRDFSRNTEYPGFTSYIRAFGSWNSALEKAGLRLNKSSSYSYMSNEQLIEEMIRFKKEEGHPPTIRELTNNPKYPGCKLYTERFGSLNNALKMAGLGFNEFHASLYSYMSDEQLIERLIQFYINEGSLPRYKDFRGNPKYPSVSLYESRFGSFTNALKEVGLDADTLIEKGMVTNESCSYLKGRLFEKLILDSFKGNAIDLSGNNCNSPFDGICPRGFIYDAKSARLSKSYNRWVFAFLNKNLKDIEYFFLGAFDKEHINLLYIWLVPNTFLNGRRHVSVYQSDIPNMKYYDITSKCMDVIRIVNK